MNIVIESRDYWVKIVEFLQQNWALIEPKSDSMDFAVFFLGDTSGVFDIIDFASQELAEQALVRNGFKRYLDPSENFPEFLYPPQPPFEWRDHPNGKIYSSGRFWKE
ncbi:MAG: hypothetical protein PHF76_12530 [Bacteroidales bacterium]|jgi:hypothetical protein|nr:hypothetical protein [Bacteroidales bacterium]